MQENYSQNNTHQQNNTQNDPFEAAFREVVTEQKQPPKKKPFGMIAAVAAAIIIGVFLFLPSGWSTEDAHNAAQACLDYYFKGDTENYVKYFGGVTEEELTQSRKDSWTSAANSLFESDVPVTAILKNRYADYYFELREKARYTAGEARKTEEGFEVPVTIEPIISLANGDFVRLDLQLNEDLSDADLNERVYTRELERMKELTDNPSYGEPKEVILHFSKGEDGYVLSQSDMEEIADIYCIRDRHWSKERAKEVVEAVLGGVYGEKYAEMSQYTVATEEEIKDTFGQSLTVENERQDINEIVNDLYRKNGESSNFSASDELVESISEAERRLFRETRYEFMGIDGDSDEYVAKIRVTPYKLDEAWDRAGEQLNEEISNISDINAYMSRYFELYAENINGIIDDGIYEDSRDYQLHLKYNDNKSYELNYNELGELNNIYNDSNLSKEDEADGEGETE